VDKERTRTLGPHVDLHQPLLGDVLQFGLVDEERTSTLGPQVCKSPPTPW